MYDKNKELVEKTSEVILNKYESLFAQYVGLYGYTNVEAYKKAYSIQTNDDVTVRKANALAKRKKIRDKIKQYNEQIEKHSIEVAKNEVGFDKSDAMKHILALIYRCEESIKEIDIPKEIVDLILECVLTDKHLEIETKIVDGKKVYPDKLEVDAYNYLTSALSKPKMDTRTADILLKANRQACELYNLLDSQNVLKLDDESKKAINILDKALNNNRLTFKELEELAYNDGKDIAS